MSGIFAGIAAANSIYPDSFASQSASGTLEVVSAAANTAGVWVTHLCASDAFSSEGRLTIGGVVVANVFRGLGADNTVAMGAVYGPWFAPPGTAVAIIDKACISYRRL